MTTPADRHGRWGPFDPFVPAVALVSFVTYALHGINGALSRDLSVYVYAGQRLVDAGVPPYVGILNRSGPFARRMTLSDTVADFRFPQEDDGPVPWRPEFFDYLYFSLSNMMAFSPTDVMPFTSRAKALMGMQAITGYALLALVIARAVNILT